MQRLRGRLWVLNMQGKDIISILFAFIINFKYHNL